LSTTQLLDTLLLIVLAVEGDADTNTGVVLNALSGLLLIGIFTGTLISLSLNDETSTASWYKALENGCELLGDLLKGSLNGFILALIQDFNEL
jgi:hypothetical protein